MMTMKRRSAAGRPAGRAKTGHQRGGGRVSRIIEANREVCMYERNDIKSHVK